MENGKWFGMKENVVKQKSFAFALRAVKLAKYLQSEKKEFVLSKPVLGLHKLNYQWLAENNEQGKTESARLSDMYVRVC
jgi:hypothetical protein